MKEFNYAIHHSVNSRPFRFPVSQFFTSRISNFQNFSEIKFKKHSKEIDIRKSSRTIDEIYKRMFSASIKVC